MKTKKLPALIVYYELDKRVNINNYLEVAINITYDKDTIHKAFDELSKLPLNIRRGFENVPSMPNYEKWLPYVSNIWIEREFYNKVEQHLTKVKMDNLTGTVCILLLIFKNIHIFEEQVHTNDSKIAMHEEFGRFLNFILKYRTESKLVATIELVKGFPIATFKHGDFIMQNLLKLIDERYENDLMGWFELHHKFRFREMELTNEGNPKDFHTYFTRFMLTKLEGMFHMRIKSQSKRCLLYNQLLSSVQINGYTEFTAEKHHDKYKEHRAKIIDRIRDKLKTMSTKKN
jgi:hypothetical protein